MWKHCQYLNCNVLFWGNLCSYVCFGWGQGQGEGKRRKGRWVMSTLFWICWYEAWSGSGENYKKMFPSSHLPLILVVNENGGNGVKYFPPFPFLPLHWFSRQGELELINLHSPPLNSNGGGREELLRLPFFSTPFQMNSLFKLEKRMGECPPPKKKE